MHVAPVLGQVLTEQGLAKGVGGQGIVRITSKCAPLIIKIGQVSLGVHRILAPPYIHKLGHYNKSVHSHLSFFLLINMELAAFGALYMPPLSFTSLKYLQDYQNKLN